MSTHNITDLNDVRKQKKLERIKEDLEQILYMFKLIKVGLKEYNYYVPVRDLYLSVINNESIVKGQLEKINTKLENLLDENN